MPMRVRIARLLLLMWVVLYVAYRLGAPDPTGVGAATSMLADLLTHCIN